MDSETIQPRPYLKLLLFAALLGLISAVITFVFMALVNVGTSAVWETAAAATGLSTQVFTLLVCTIGGLLVGVLVKDLRRSLRDLRRDDGRVRSHRPLRLSSRARHRADGARLARIRRQPRPGGADGRRLRQRGHLVVRTAQARRTGHARAGFLGSQRMLGAFFTSPFGGALLGLEASRGASPTRGRCFPAWSHQPSPRPCLSCSPARTSARCIPCRRIHST